MYNTRIAPSPTGDFHMGTARTAYFNWLVARATGGKFILRIDDTDLNRNDQSKIDDIFRVMDWLGLDYDEVVYQSQRIKRYRACADLLIDYKAAKHHDGAIILDLDLYPKYSDLKNITTRWFDEIAGEILITEQDFNYIKNMPLIKKDGMPTYNFASIVDDIDFKINYIIRGVDHQKNTSKQVVLQNVIFPDYSRGQYYAHVGLLTKDKKKLSKRDGAASMISYMNAGYDPDAMLNFLLRLGWGPTKDDKSTAIIDRDMALKLFLNHGKMKNSPANIDLAKLDSFDKKYKARKKV